jgi:predicted metal-binding protein
MSKTLKIGIIICHRYHTCAGGKCFRAMHNHEGAFSRYDRDTDLQLVGYTTCDGCPGGNIEYAPEEMIKNGAEVIHLATGLVVGYPPCPYIDHFREFIKKRYKVEVVVGTHPIPQKYLDVHSALGTWADQSWEEKLAPTLADGEIRLAYN